jgi:acyl carrier protein
MTLLSQAEREENKMFEKVKEIIVDTLGCDEEAVVMEATLKEDLGADSLDAVELNMALEEEFGISISDEELMTFVTVKDIVTYIEKNA